MDNCKNYNIKLIKKHLRELLKIDYKKLDVAMLIVLEHRLFNDVYAPFKEIGNKDER